MSHPMDTNTSRALIIGASEFPKDSNLNSSEAVIANLKSFADILANEKIIGLADSQVNILENNQDNTAIKEQLALAAEQSGSTLIVYYTGHIVIRKGQLFLGTYNSTLKQIHVNGISLAELMSILGESEISQKILIFDAVYSNTASGLPEDTEQIIKNTFNHYEQEHSDIFLISSPGNTYNINDHPNFTNRFVEVLSKGIPEEKGILSLQDIYDALSTLSEQDNKQGFPIFGKKGRKSTITFAYNHQFIRFRDLRKQAERLFDEGNYQEVLPLYREASNLFPENEYINTKLQFTSHFLLANELFAEKEYLEAKKNFEESRNFFDLPVVSAKINDCIEKIASELYDQSDYAQALPYYEYLVKNSESNIFYNRRLKVCQDEIRFTELIDNADRAYFEDNYKKALQFYNSALEINMDNLVVRRKEECERFFEKENSLREKLRKEISEEILQKQRAIIDEKIAEEKEKLKKQFQLNKTDSLAKAREEASKAFEDKIESKLSEMEMSFWKRLSVWNSIEGYKFYLDFFSKGQFVKKAHKRIQQLEEKNANIIVNHNGLSQELSSKKTSETAKNLNGIHKEDSPEKDEKEERSSVSQVERISLADLIKPSDFVEEEQEPKVEETKGATESQATIGTVENEEVKNKEEVEEISAASEEKQEVDAIPQDATEEELWNYACNANTVASFMNYINNTKESRYIAEAYNKVGELSRIETDDETKSESFANGQVKSDAFIADVVENRKEQEGTLENSFTEKAEDTPTNAEQNESSEDSEDALWQRAEKLDTVASYMEYIENTKEGEHIADAYFKINSLNKSDSENLSNEASGATEEEVAEEVSMQSIEPLDLEEEIISEQERIEPMLEMKNNSSSQNGMHTKEEAVATAVKPHPANIEEGTLWQRAKAEDTVSAYFNYMNNTTEKRYWDVAKARIGELKNNSQSQELQDWTQAQEEDTVDSYKKYIRKYPLGSYYAKAMFRLNRLES